MCSLFPTKQRDEAAHLGTIDHAPSHGDEREAEAIRSSRRSGYGVAPGCNELARRAIGRPSSLGCHARRSPVTETVTRVSLTNASQGAERWIVVVNDGLEVSDFANFECARVTSCIDVRAFATAQALAPTGFSRRHSRPAVLPRPRAGGRRPLPHDRGASH
jgi:hypothetical protein